MASAVVVKEIKPGRFNDQAFTAAINAEMKRVADGMQDDFEATTVAWEHLVTFTQELNLDPNGPEVLVGTDDRIYGYVNDGTRPHPIFPKRAKALRFQWGGKGSYKPKTRPRVISSFQGGPSGPMVAFPYVQHPGTEARKFDEVIQKKWEAPFKRRMEQAMRDAADASGHGID